jgi:hypothetical protein
MMLRAFFCSLVLTVVTAAGCSKSPTSPTTTTTTTATATVAAPAYFEDFTANVPVTGSSFYSFTVTQYGQVNISMTSVSGQYVPSTVTMGLALGKPDGEGCTPTTSLTATAGAGPQLTGSYDAGVYCVKIYDVGNLFSTANVAMSIAYP